MSEILSKLKGAILNKTFLCFVLGAILGAVGVELSEETLGQIICLIPGIEGCQ